MIHLEKRIVTIAGLPLTGKTTLGNSLAKKTDAKFLDVEDARQEIDPGKKWLGDEGERDIMLKAYERNHERAREFLKDEKAVILIATYSRSIYHKMLNQLASQEKVPLIIFLLSNLSDINISKRLEKRIEKGDKSNIDSLEKYHGVGDRYQPPTGKDVIIFDANQTTDKLTKAALSMLGK